MSKTNTNFHSNLGDITNSLNELSIKQHKQFSSLEELNSFLVNLFNLISNVKGLDDIHFIIYGGAIRDILLEKSINDIDIAIFYHKNSKDFRCDELHSRLLIISDFTENFFGFKINIDRKKLDYSLLKMNITLPNNLFVNIDITSYNKKKNFCDFTINNLQYQFKNGLNTIVKGKHDILQSIKDINTKTLRFVSDITTLKFCERTKLVERSIKMLERGFKYDNNVYQKEPFLDISNENKCSICHEEDNIKYYLCSTCNASYHIHCANTYILDCIKQNKDIITCPTCRQ
jgi:hypothetical protein